MSDATSKNALGKECAQIAESAVIYPGASILNTCKNPDDIVIGEHTHIKGELDCDYGGKLKIGNWSYVGHLSRILSWDSVSIGNYVLISHMVDIIDSDTHTVNVKERRAHIESILGGKDYPKTESRVGESKPIVIEDDVWIGLKATILKGVRIGQGAIIAAGAVVTKDVEPWTVVAGNPARVVRELEIKDRC